MSLIVINLFRYNITILQYRCLTIYSLTKATENLDVLVAYEGILFILFIVKIDSAWNTPACWRILSRSWVGKCERLLSDVWNKHVRLLLVPSFDRNQTFKVSDEVRAIFRNWLMPAVGLLQTKKRNEGHPSQRQTAVKWGRDLIDAGCVGNVRLSGILGKLSIADWKQQ